MNEISISIVLAPFCLPRVFMLTISNHSLLSYFFCLILPFACIFTPFLATHSFLISALYCQFLSPCLISLRTPLTFILLYQHLHKLLQSTFENCKGKHNSQGTAGRYLWDWRTSSSLWTWFTSEKYLLVKISFLHHCMFEGKPNQPPLLAQQDQVTPLVAQTQ